MKLRCYRVAAVFVTTVLSYVTTQAQLAKPNPATYQQQLAAAPLLFMENKGQVTDDKNNPQPGILFTAHSSGAKIYLTGSSIHYQFSKIDKPAALNASASRTVSDKWKVVQGEETLTPTHRFTIALQGANPQPTVQREGRSSYFENYYLPQYHNSITEVHGYEKITFKEVYPNIDWVLYSRGGYMEYDFLVHPGGNPASIQLKIKDAGAVSITPKGELLIKTSLGEVKEKAPVSYSDGRIVASRFIQNSDGSIGFRVQPQPGKTLRIDPSVVWSTYYGGSDPEYGNGCATDNAGNVYLTGFTLSGSGIAAGGFQNTIGGGVDAFLVKFNNAGVRLWATYYGGNSLDQALSCAVDINNNVYISGNTSSTNGIASGGFQNTSGGDMDAFLAKFSATGARIWATYYGGTDGDYNYGCATDTSGNVYLAGYTNSTSGIAANGFQNSISNASIASDGFLVKFSSSGSRLWGTYYGGTCLDYAYGCATDINNNVYLAGFTQSATGIASGGFQNTSGGGDEAFLVKFNAAGSRLWGTYYGGTGAERAYAVATDEAANVYLSGTTNSTNGIAANGFQNVYAGGNNDMFLVAFAGSGNRLWGTYYGGDNGEDSHYCVSDRQGHIYLLGNTSSAAGIASGGFQNTLAANGDGCIVKFNNDGTRVWGSYFGGNGSDGLYGATFDYTGNLFVAGSTGSATGIAYNGFQTTYAGGGDATLAKINPASGALPVKLTSFTAWQQATDIVVEWKVQQETGVRQYEVEKSLNGRVYNKMNEQPTTGNNRYTWTDGQPQSGNNYYRLRTVDADGKITYSAVVKIVFGGGQSALAVYPNPVVGSSIQLSFNNQPQGVYTVQLFNAASQLVLSQQVQHQGGSRTETVFLNNLSTGTYLLEVTASGHQKQTFKVIKR